MLDHHRATELAPQPTDLADTHRPKNLQQLVPPRSAQVDEALHRPIVVELLRQLSPDLVAMLEGAARPALDCEENRQVKSDGVHARDNRLGNVVGSDDSAAAEQSDCITPSLID